MKQKFKLKVKPLPKIPIQKSKKVKAPKVKLLKGARAESHPSGWM